MRKIIVVAGTANTGKTKSIRRFLEDLGVFHKKRKGDLVLVIPPLPSGKKRVLGVATGGDNINVVRNSLKFIDKHEWGAIVCASKGRGVTLNYVQAFAKANKAKPIIINTQKVQVGAIAAEITHTARLISEKL